MVLYKKIVEEKDTTLKQKSIKEVNGGLYVFKTRWLQENIGAIKKSVSGEYYIVDLAKIALEQKEKVVIHQLQDESEWVGVNTKEQLQKADRKMREKINKYWISAKT